MNLSQPQIKEIGWALASYKAKLPCSTTLRATAYKEYADYYAGRHKLTFATQKFLDAFGEIFAAMSENLCPAVVDGLADRLQLQTIVPARGASTPGAKVKRVSPVQKAIAEIERRNRLDQLQGEVHKDALTYGDSYIIVWPDDENEPVFFPNLPGEVTVKYHSEKLGYIIKAAKWFKFEDKIRLNIYFPDRIEKYITINKYSALPSTPAAFKVYEAPDEAWPLVNPYGKVPVFHWANNAGVGQPGNSELRDIIPLQDALNKSLCDMLVAMEFEAFAQRWVTGLQPRKDEEGNPIAPFKAGIDRLWIAKDKETNFGEFSRANLDNFVKVQDSLRAAIARVSGFPLHYFMLQQNAPPSGESLRVASERVTAKVTDRQISFGNRWEDAFRFALEIKGFKDVETQASWKDSTPRLGEKEIWEVATLQRDNGVSKKQVLVERGYTAEQYEEFKAENFDDEFGDGAPGASTPAGATDVVADAETEAAVKEQVANSDVELNGAQIKAATDVVAQFKAGQMSAGTAISFLTAVGIPRATAEEMIANETAKTTPAAA